MVVKRFERKGLEKNCSPVIPLITIACSSLKILFLLKIFSDNGLRIKLVYSEGINQYID